jgi:hypothetical protein
MMSRSGTTGKTRCCYSSVDSIRVGCSCASAKRRGNFSARKGQHPNKRRLVLLVEDHDVEDAEASSTAEEELLADLDPLRVSRFVSVAMMVGARDA